MKRHQAEAIVKLYEKKDKIEKILAGFSKKPNEYDRQRIVIDTRAGNGTHDIVTVLGLDHDKLEQLLNDLVKLHIEEKLKCIKDEIEKAETEI